MAATVPKEICILRLSAIGDCCHVVPVVNTLRRAWPQARLTWIVGKVEASLVGDIPGIEFVVLDKGAGWRGYAALRRKLQGRRFDLLLHMHASMRANLVSLLVKSPRRLGFDRSRARDRQWIFTNERIAQRPRQHVLDGLFGFAEHLGITDRDLRWEIPVSTADRAAMAAMVDNDRPLLVISPCSSQRLRNFRNWHVDRYIEVARHAIGRYGMQVAVSGGNTELEHDYGRQMCAADPANISNLVGKTSLKQLLALLERAQAVLCPDSGPAHMATAAGTPVIGLYATSNPGRTGPYLSRQWVVDKYPQAVAAEFGKKVEDLRWGTRVRNPEAMDLITVSEVNARLDELLAGISG
ncbi:MAG: glycosyltransferase family 9 protein [Gammaproteobacteria bacterium]|nr:glycosyltransferase family 9 protein [Gammaproteobacteria bacterium]NNF60662.1 glycosyltransferase family 9 protein [Gammaproteobacteria bacterium]